MSQPHRSNDPPPEAPAYDRYGPPGARLAIVLHGAVVNRKTWLPLSRAVADDVELWCPDLPGHGARRDEPFVLARAVADVASLVARAAPRRVTLAGDSLGGYVALVAAAYLAGSNAIASVVAGGCTWSMHGAHGWLARASDVVPAAALRIAGAARTERAFAAVLTRLLDATTASAVLAAGLRPAARAESLRELAGLDLTRVVPGIAAPIVFANGRFDWPTRAGERTLARVARAGSVVIAPHAGHGIGCFAPATFARAIERSLAPSAVTVSRRRADRR